MLGEKIIFTLCNLQQRTLLLATFSKSLTGSFGELLVLNKKLLNMHIEPDISKKFNRGCKMEVLSFP